LFSTIQIDTPLAALPVMSRRRNWFLLIGFLFVLAGLFTFEFFIQFPITRDFPWANLLLLAIGAVILFIGIKRAFTQRDIYRGRVAGPILGTLSLLVIGFFCFASFYLARQIPAAVGAPRVGQPAPEFSLPDQDGKQVALAELVRDNRAAILIFYRGHW
jgi:hypothetical protein